MANCNWSKRPSTVNITCASCSFTGTGESCGCRSAIPECGTDCGCGCQSSGTGSAAGTAWTSERCVYPGSSCGCCDCCCC